MSEELYGAEATEAAAGYSPMPEAPPSESTDIGSDHDSLRDAAHELTERRETPQGLDTVEYKKPDERGRPTRERADPKETIKLERGAKDLAAWREAQAKADEAEAEAAVREHVDSLRQGGPGTIQNQQNANQPQYTPAQTEAQQNLNNAYQQSPMHGFEQTAHQM